MTDNLPQMAQDAATTIFETYISDRIETVMAIAEAAEIDVDTLISAVMEDLNELPPSDAKFREKVVSKAQIAGSKLVLAIDPETGALVYRKINDLGKRVELTPDPDLNNRFQVRMRRRADDGQSGADVV